MMLERSLGLIDGAGANRRGERGPAPWRFALSRSPARVLVVGPATVDDALVVELRSAGAQVTVVEESATVSPDAAFDLAITARPTAAQLTGLQARASVVLARQPADPRAESAPEPPGAVPGVVPAGVTWRFVRDGGVLRGVVPEGDLTAEAWLEARIVGDRPPGRARALRGWACAVARDRTPVGARERAGGLEGIGVDVWGEPAVPAYLVRLAAARGIDLRAHRWALWCRGDYASQKLVVALWPPGGDRPELVVKVARDARSSARLANEAEMLDRLAASVPAAADRAPAVRFTGDHDGSFVCAQSALRGEPFRRVARPGPATMDLVADGARWLTELGAATARTVPASAFRPPLEALVGRFAAVFDPPRRTRAALDAQVSALCELPALPVVAVHGDPGVWNTLVDGGRLRFLDWESAEPDGLPLWDLLHFLRSGLLAADPSRGWRSRLAVLRRHLVRGSALTPRVAAHLVAGGAAVGLPVEATEPLVHLCWLHRAVKEASRLAPGQAGRSHYAALLRLGLEGRDDAGFRLLVGRPG